MKIGERIKLLRISKNMTQEELAERSDLTRGFISQLERDLTSPTLENLDHILRALGSDTVNFFSKMDDQKKIVYKKDERIPIYDMPSGVKEFLIMSQTDPKKIEPRIVELNPSSQSILEQPHEGFEFGYIIDGNVALLLNGTVYRLKKDEAFFYESIMNHQIKNISRTQKAKVLWIEIY